MREHDDEPLPVKVGSGLMIRELAGRVRSIVGFEGNGHVGPIQARRCPRCQAETNAATVRPARAGRCRRRLSAVGQPERR